MKLTFLAALICLRYFFVEADLASQYNNFAALDEAEKVKLFWSVNFEDEKIEIAVEAKTEGWIGFGISSGQGKMEGADIVIGWVKDGKPYFADRYARGHVMPEKDLSQDYQLISLTEANRKTTMTFERKLRTCDKYDNDILEGTTKVIYAYHQDDPASEDDIPQHGSMTRGAKSLMLVNTHQKKISLPENTQYFDIVANKTNVPAQDTTYWCTAHEIPVFQGKRHVVKVAPIIQEGNEGLVHHMVIYQCKSDFPRSNLTFRGQCYSPNMPPIRACAGGAVMAAWAVGGQAFYYPEHVGLALGEKDSPKIILLEVHYDNPDRRSDFEDSSGLRFFYTDQLRQYDAGSLIVGCATAHTLTIPPGQAYWESEGYCLSQCTREGLKDSPLSSGGINVFATLLHSHLVGRQMALKHVRSGTELPLIAKDDNYDFNYQEYQVTRREITVLPGDDIVMTCGYNTRSRKNTTLGGLSTRNEMCVAFMMYYPKTILNTCISSDTSGWMKFYDKYFTNGTHPVTKFPPNKWNATMVEDLKKSYDDSTKVFVYCAGQESEKLPGLYHAEKEKPVYKSLPREEKCESVNSTAGKPSSFSSLVLLLSLLCIL